MFGKRVPTSECLVAGVWNGFPGGRDGYHPQLVVKITILDPKDVWKDGSYFNFFDGVLRGCWGLEWISWRKRWISSPTSGEDDHSRPQECLGRHFLLYIF